MAQASDLKTALWLQPRAGPLYDALTQTIAGLRPLFDDASKFAPHVTLTSGIFVKTQGDVDRVLDGAHAAAKSVPHVDVVLQHVTYGSHYFRKVVLEVEPQAELVSLAAICREKYIIWPETLSSTRNYDALSEQEHDELDAAVSDKATKWVTEEYKPHLSLVYSDLYPISEAIRHTVEQRLRDVFGSTYATRGIGWTGGRIALVHCQGPPDQWRVLGYRYL